MSSDFGTAGVTLETRMGTAKQDVDAYAKAVDGIGSSSKDAAEHVDRLEKTSQNLAAAQKAVSDGARNIAEMQKRGLIGTEDYLKAMDKQRLAYQQMIDMRKRATQAVVDADAAAARSAKAATGGSRPGVADIATGVGVGVAAERVVEALVDKAKEFVTGSVEQASKLQETLSTNADVFTGYAGEIDKFGSTAARSLGMSKQAAIEAADSFGAVFHAVGVGDDKAVGLSTSLTKLGADLAAFKHEADPGQALHALEQGLSGQYDALHQYDVILTTATVRQEAFRLGLIRTRTDALTPQATALAAASLVTQQAQTQTGAFARSTDELGGKQKVLKANIADAQAELGKGLLPAMSGAADIANGTLVPALKGVGAALGFIGEHDLTRHIAEIALGMYALSIAVGVTSAAYVRLTGAATTAAEAEVAATGAGAGGAALGGRGLLLAAARTPVGILTAGALLSGASQISSSKALARDAKADHDAAAAAKTLDEARKVAADLETKSRSLANQHNDAGLLQVGKEFLGFGTDPLEAAAAASNAAAEARAHVRQLEAQLAMERSRARSGVPYIQAQVRAERAQARVATADYNVRDARAYLNSRSYLKDAGSIPLGGLLDALPEKPDKSIVADAREALDSSKAAVAIAQARVKQAQQARGGSTAGQIASAEAAVISARNATQRRGGNPEVEALRLQAAEERLAKVKQGSATNTLALQTAEKGLADARRSSERAAANLHKAEKEASGDKSISLKDVLARASHAATTATAEEGNVRTLVKAKLTEPVIAELEKLEQTAPGTIAKVAKGITPAFVKQLNADQAARDNAAIQLAKLGGQAKLKTAQAEAAASGKALGDALAASLVAALKDPAWQAAAHTALGQLLLPGGGAGGKGTGKPGATTSVPGFLGSLFGPSAGQPRGITAGVTVVAPQPVVVHAAPAPAPVIVAPRQTTNHNTFPNVKTTAQMRAELAKLERIDALR